MDLIGYAEGFILNSEVSSEIGVALGNGDGTFQPVEISPSSSLYFGSFALADFNGDGRVDMAQLPPQSGLPPTIQLGSSRTPSTTVLSSSLNPSQIGESVTLAAGIRPATSVGSVAFYSLGVNFAQQLLGEATVTNGVSTLTLSTLPGGTDNLYAVYLGGGKLLPSSSNVVFQQVTASK